jgi:hypothetical protein
VIRTPCRTAAARRPRAARARLGPAPPAPEAGRHVRAARHEPRRPAADNVKGGATLTYVFCLVRSTRKPHLPSGAAGLPGAGDLRLLQAWPSTWMVVANVDAHEYESAALATGLQNMEWVGRRAVAHEAVVEEFLTAPAVLPMQLLTLFTSDERALAHVRKNRVRIDRILKRIDRQHEWGLRLTFDEKSVRETVTARGAPTTGAAYLSRKRDLMDVVRVELVDARAEAGRVFRALAREATAARRRTSTEHAAPGSRLLLDAAFLVPVRRASAFRAALRKQARAFRAAGIVVSLTGPWPPYNFI